jgi:beta-lactam-binding protein with PASTA domain
VTVPDLVGLTLSNARAAWTAAGFTGSFSPAFGLNNKIVTSQSQVAGECLPATTAIAVTYS